MMRGKNGRARSVAAVALLASCTAVLGAGSPQGAVLPEAQRTAQAPQRGQQEQAGGDCDVYKSVPPSGEDGPAVKAIKAKRSLVIGIDLNSYRWGARNPDTGQIEGFDIDLARAIGTAIMGDPDKVTLKAVPTADRIKFIQEGRVDMIVRTMTITCDRLEQVAFSRPYFNTSQRVVVPKSSPARSLDEALNGATVCAAAGSSAQDELKNHPVKQVVSVENHLDCLVLMQLGKVDATMTDDALAASQAAQDQTVRVVDGEIRPGVMGIAMLKTSTDLTARVNQVLADYYGSGAWRGTYDRWLKPYLLNDADHYWPVQH
ncbi:glutamate ABC transporter substrate-binding protein [Kitasatospora sp. CM 4170]|uniref:Glutamate ABC transporter substrate-binding protein n=2 Tax=Kitasatospora aburaviensis TaxID=67265 RepID=A0ABW1F8K5_9ACTN|nr:glutamate ABC transporter substrate-binding protein [Kitasatospora sp. CM 4170]WNM48028.1 glutamate ABC transporter substrate-binding protein [Kitasatospora sp. CM 4170]